MKAHAPRLAAIGGLAHGFFGRAGGVSRGLYASLNCGFGADDDPAHVAANRARAMAALALAPESLVTLYQIHSAEAVTVAAPWSERQGPRADAMVTDRPGVTLGILAADCVPVLFADADARVIGAAHAGWKGALAGVVEATVAAMERLGAARSRIVAAIGPCIRQQAYEVGPDFHDQVRAADPDGARFFAPGLRPGKLQFDLAGYCAGRLARAGVVRPDDLALCTYAAPEAYFSYRRTTHAGEPDYGRNLSAIALRPDPRA